MKTIFYLLSVFAAIIFISCHREANSGQISAVTTTVFHKHVDYAIPPDFDTIKGLQIKESNSGEWIKIVGISGFTYEENYEYQLKLEKTFLNNPPMDSPSRTEYKLLEILAKTQKY